MPHKVLVSELCVCLCVYSFMGACLWAQRGILLVYGMINTTLETSMWLTLDPIGICVMHQSGVWLVKRQTACKAT